MQSHDAMEIIHRALEDWRAAGLRLGTSESSPGGSYELASESTLELISEVSVDYEATKQRTIPRISTREN